MEDTNNSNNTDAIIQELQKINESVIGSNQKIDQLTEYLIIQDNREKREADAAAEAKAKADADKDQEVASAHEEAVAKEQAEQEINETYTELLTDIRDQVSLTNHLLAVQGVFIGIVIGLLFMKSIFDRIFK